MSHYERRLEADRDKIYGLVRGIASAVAEALHASIEALLAGDTARSYQIALQDLPINRAVRQLDAKCHAFVARHLPSAGHLRFISSVMRLNVALERVGDYAVTICREAAQLEERVPASSHKMIAELGAEAEAVLRRSVQAFLNEDVDLARTIRPAAKAFGRSYEIAHRALLTSKEDRSLPDLLALITIYTKLDRVSDQAKNIGEEALFTLTGETKAPKIYRVLFISARDSTFGPLAAAIAHKAFPGSGVYDSVGWVAAEAIAAEAQVVADELGLDLSAHRPAALPSSDQALDGYHVIVGLGANIRRNLGRIPYSTVYLEWPLPSLEGDPHRALRQGCKDLSASIQELIFTLRGEDAP